MTVSALFMRANRYARLSQLARVSTTRAHYAALAAFALETALRSIGR